MAEQKRHPDRNSEGGKTHQGIVRDNKGQEQPADKQRAQQVSRKDRGGDPPGDTEGDNE